jgi:cystathionine gamma-lyase
MLWIETPTNPLLKIADIEACSKIAHEAGLVVVVDNTFASPFFQNPLKHGADLVVHSVTKYLNGHSDVVMGTLSLLPLVLRGSLLGFNTGVVAGNDDGLLQRLKFLQNSIGAIPSPFDSFLAVRGTKTLHVRMRQHAENALAVAKYLEKHPKVEKVRTHQL